MTSQTHSFESFVRSILNKSSSFSPREVEGLLAILLALIGSPSFSLKKVSANSSQKLSRNFLAKCLKKYAYIQRRVLEVALTEVKEWPKYHGEISLLLDDTIVKKSGRRIFGSFKFFDHSLGRCIQSFCLVNVAVVLNEELLFILPWLLLDSRKPTNTKRRRRVDRDQKTIAGIELLTFFINYFKKYSISSRKIDVLADSWFSNQTMMGFVKEQQLIYRLDGKKNYQVQQPDHEAISRRNETRRGRKRLKFVKYRSLEQYFLKAGNWYSFYDSKSQERIYWKSAEVTLKTAGRVRVYAFQWKKRTTTKFILTPPVRYRKPTPKKVHADYSVRWRIEEAHRDLKQQFSLSKSQSREGWVVSGFIGLVAFTYSLWKCWASFQQRCKNIVLKCPTWAEMFYHQQIIALYTVKEG